jgi:hypothetical protein
MLLAVAIAGCSGSSSSSSSPGNGVASKPPAEILAATKSAAEHASSAHIAGALRSGGSPITLDLDLLAGHGGRGRLSEGSLAFELIVVDGTVYIKGSPSFYRRFGGTAAARLFQGKWLRSSTTGSELATLASLTDLGRLLDQTLADHGTLTKGATTTAFGQPVIELQDTSKDGSLYVATTGQPYPIEIVKRGSDPGHVAFTRWNEPVSLSAPSGAVDIGQLRAEH